MTYQVALNGRQYSELERILRGNQSLSKRLAENKAFDSRELLEFIVFELQDLKKDGCGIEDFGIPVLTTITEAIYPDDREYFVRQIGKTFHMGCELSIQEEGSCILFVI